MSNAYRALTGLTPITVAIGVGDNTGCKVVAERRIPRAGDVFKVSLAHNCVANICEVIMDRPLKRRLSRPNTLIALDRRGVMVARLPLHLTPDNDAIYNEPLRFQPGSIAIPLAEGIET